MTRPARRSPTRVQRGVRLAASVLAAGAVASCAPSASSPGEAPATEPAQVPAPAPSPAPGPGPAPACVVEGPRYLAFLGSGTCRDVASARSPGTWVARALFPDAPEEVRDSACSYAWKVPPLVSPAPPADVEALSTIGADHLARGIEAQTTCEAPLLAPGSASLSAARDAGGADGAPTGVSGCDVCARVFGKLLFVILPPDQLDLRTVVVTTTEGRLVSFDVDVPAGTQAFAVELPSTAQDRYKEGRVPLFRAPF